jgi:O-antigen/teichoic acid export membrane protein
VSATGPDLSAAPAVQAAGVAPASSVSAAVPFAMESSIGVDRSAGLFSLLLRSLSWAAAARLVSTVGNITKYVVFARLLSPFDFGVTTVALSTLDLLSALSSTSFERALVQQDAEVGPYLDTVWTTSLARGIALTAIILFAARPIAIFFRQDSAYLVFCAVTPVALLRACQSPACVLLYRRMEFHVVLILNVAELIASFAVGIAAIVYIGDWRGLVVATIAGQAARTALSYWYFPYRPRLRFDLMRAREMFAFGRWVTGAGISEFLAVQLDNFTVAHLLGPQALGEYQLAFRIGEMPAGEFALSASIVTFPLVARLTGQREVRRKLFAYSSAVIVVVGLVYSFMVLSLGRSLLEVCFTSKWLGALPALRLLCFYGIFQGILILGRSFLDGIGTPGSSFGITAVRAVVLAILIYPLTLAYGTAGAAVAALVSVVAPIPIMLVLYERASVRKP